MSNASIRVALWVVYLCSQPAGGSRSASERREPAIKTGSDPGFGDLLSVLSRRKHLSQVPLFAMRNALVRPAGVEPATYWSVASRSIQLSYGRTRVESPSLRFRREPVKLISLESPP
jgi:hypothetical protein